MVKIVKNCQIFGQVMFPHHSDQLSQKSQVFRVALCLSKVKVPGLWRLSGGPLVPRLSVILVLSNVSKVTSLECHSLMSKLKVTHSLSAQ